MKLQLSMCLGDYDINQALLTGEVQPDGIELTAFTADSPHRHWRMARHHEFDVAEFSTAKVTMLGAQGRAADLGLAIPAFPHRRFRHGFIYVAADSPITDPHQLNGGRIGLRSWQNTAGMWLRGMIQDHHGVDLSSITWVPQDDEDIALPESLTSTFERPAPGDDVFEMLVRGELDAVIYPEPPEELGKPGARIRTLFADVKAAEMEFYRSTGIFPIMHTVVIKHDVLERHPWAAVNLLEAFRRSKELAFERMRNIRSISIAWLGQAKAEQDAVMGPDPWRYNFADNRDQLQMMMRWSHEQGLAESERPVEELFVPSTIDEAPSFVGS
jgi:4,5-dihydroxyphthalate decarboxylase